MQRKNPATMADIILLDVAKSLGILMLCTGIGFLFYLWGLSEANTITIYILGILVIASITAYSLFGVVSSVLGVLLFNFLFAEPLFNLQVYDPQYTITIVVMLGASLLISSLTSRFREQAAAEARQTKRTEFLLETSQKLHAAVGNESILDMIAGQLAKFLSRVVVVFSIEEKTLGTRHLSAGEEGYPYEPDLDRKEIEQWLAVKKKDGKSYTIRRETCKTRYFVAETRRSMFAAIGIVMDPADNILIVERDVLTAVLDELAGVLARNRLDAENERISMQAETERTRANFLRSVSHDLRTPLTSISGMAGILLTKGGDLSEETRGQLYKSIADDAEWLIGVVENLLYITRVEDGKISINTEPELISELISEALFHIGKRTAGHMLTTEIEDDMLMVDADSHLVTQLIINLVDNAIKYTPEGTKIVITAKEQNGKACIEIADEGSGIPDGSKEKIFERFYTAPKVKADSRRGMGLGLSICKSIAGSHGGEIYVRDNEPKGSIFGFTLPIDHRGMETDKTTEYEEGLPE